MSNRLIILRPVAATTAALALLGCYAWATPRLAPLSPGPKDVVQQLDRVVQARFQDADAGEFGPERFQASFIDGHFSVTGLVNNETAHEKRILKPLRKAPYFVIVGIMHLRHKPGHHTEQPGAPADLRDPLPSAEVLEASGTTRARVERTLTWADSNINRATLWAAKQVKGGETVDTTYGKFAVAIRPIRAEHAGCITCHTGSKRNDVLGAMVYMVAPTAHNAPAKVFVVNGEGGA